VVTALDQCILFQTTTTFVNILALEPWYGGSHRVFLDSLVKHSRHTFRTVTLPGRFWRWRMEGGAVSLAQKAIKAYDEGFVPDVIFASDMVNLPAFLSLTRPMLSDVPTVLFFHENQLTYPIPEGESRDRAYGLINYLSGLTADRLVFNSQFHHDEFMEALPSLLRDFPDHTNIHTVQDMKARSEVLYLGLDLEAHEQYRDSEVPHAPGRPYTILWNQRWEYDKNPSAFFETMNRLDDAGYDFRLILAGKHFRTQPESFKRAFERYAERILHYGYADTFDEYSRLLHRADLVVSTAIHEFFGIAMMEAIYCGCHPLLPRRLSYPELIPEELHRPLLHAPIMYDDQDDLFRHLSAILGGDERPLPLSTLKGIVEPLGWRTQVDAYDDLFEEVATSEEPRPVPSAPLGAA